MSSKSEYSTILSADSSFEFDSVCLPPDRQIPLHTGNVWELSCIVTGEGTRLLSEVSEPFTDKDTVLVPPGMPHCWYFRTDATDSAGNISNISIFFSIDFPKRIADTFPEFSDAMERLADQRDAMIFSGITRERIYSTMQRMKTEDKQRRLLSLLEILLMISEAGDVRKIADTTVRNKESLRLSQIQSYVNCNYARPLTIDEMAGHIGMNRTSFCSFFKRCTGITFTRYLNERRLKIACDYLEHDPERHINEVSTAVGIPDTPYFCRIFKKRFGLTPSEWRVQMYSGLPEKKGMDI